MRWGTWVARHRWWVPSVWAVVLVVAALSYPHLLRSLSASDYSVTGSDLATRRGTANWWLPHWLQHILPKIRLE